MSVGPVCLAIAAGTGSQTYLRFGLTLVWLAVLVPAFAWLAGTYNSSRPGASELYDPCEWTFSDEGIGIRQPGRDAHAAWTEFKRWRSAGKALLLHTSLTHYIVIPWRDVVATDRDGLEELLEAHIGRQKR
jgi:hypothetical protein